MNDGQMAHGHMTNGKHIELLGFLREREADGSREGDRGGLAILMGMAKSMGFRRSDDSSIEEMVTVHRLNGMPYQTPAFFFNDPCRLSEQGPVVITKDPDPLPEFNRYGGRWFLTHYKDVDPNGRP